MSLSQKCQYAVRAVYELARRRQGGELTTIAHIARAQAVPARFLETILAQLRQAGFVEARRGVQGGYLLRVAPKDLTVGEVIRSIDGPQDPVRCTNGRDETCPLMGKCVFMKLWQDAALAAANVYQTTFLDLLEQAQSCQSESDGDYTI
jgi:Rrf2 family transcriptional regulator, cysteine metabolism repressor